MKMKTDDESSKDFVTSVNFLKDGRSGNDVALLYNAVSIL